MKSVPGSSSSRRSTMATCRLLESETGVRQPLNRNTDTLEDTAPSDTCCGSSPCSVGIGAPTSRGSLSQEIPVYTLLDTVAQTVCRCPPFGNLRPGFLEEPTHRSQ